jgi:murein DD-endopeptidase MepM/ murein hydrolase activator NlpD
VIGAEKTDSAGDIEFGPTDFTDDGEPARLMSEALESTSGLTAGESSDIDFKPGTGVDFTTIDEARAASENIDQVQGYDPTSVSLANRDTSVFRQGGADVIGGDVPSRARDLLDFAGGVPVIPAVATRIEKSLTDAINQSRQAGVDPVANERAQANLANITEDFNRLPENIRRAFPRRFRDALENMETKGENPEQQIVQIENALASLEDVALTGQSVGEYIATVDPNDPDQIEGLGNLLEFVDNPEALGDRASVLVGFEQPRPERDSRGYFGLSAPGTPILGGVGQDLRNALDRKYPTLSAYQNRVESLIRRAQKLSAENDFYDPPGTYGTNRFLNILESQSKEPVPTRQDEPPNIDFKQTPDQIEVYEAPVKTPDPPPVATAETPDPLPVATAETPDPPPVATAETPDPPPVATAEPETQFRSLASLDSDQRDAFDRTLGAVLSQANQLIPGTTSRKGANARFQTQIFNRLDRLGQEFNIDPVEMNQFKSQAAGEKTEDTTKSEDPMGNPASPKMTDDEIQASLMRSINTLAEGAEDFPRTPTERNIDTLAQGVDDKMPTLGEASTMITVDPLPSKTINRPYFTEPRDHPILDDARGHKGIDLAAKEGDPIQLIASGTVSSVKRDPMGSAGIKVEVDHPNGMRTKYFHGSGIPDDIQVGQQLDAGTTIMFAGSSGVYTSGPKKGQPSSTGPHLHFEVGEVKNGQFIAMDPEDVFPEIFGEYKRKREDQGNPSDEDVLMQYM